MWRRFIIRSFVFGLLLLSLGGWVWSYVQVTNIVHNDVNNGHSQRLMIRCGRIFLDYQVTQPRTKDAYTFGDNGWSFDSWQYSECFPRSFHTNGWGPDWLGFAFRHDVFAFFGSSIRSLSVPFWFFSALLTFVLFWSWWKTVATKRGGAFPVETASNKIPQ